VRRRLASVAAYVDIGSYIDRFDDVLLLLLMMLLFVSMFDRRVSEAFVFDSMAIALAVRQP
jgi:hypothetical protein